MEELIKLLQEAIKGLNEGDKVKLTRYFEDLIKEDPEKAKKELTHFNNLKKYTNNKRVLVRAFTEPKLQPYKDSIVEGLGQVAAPGKYKNIAQYFNKDDILGASKKYGTPIKAPEIKPTEPPPETIEDFTSTTPEPTKDNKFNIIKNPKEWFKKNKNKAVGLGILGGLGLGTIWNSKQSQEQPTPSQPLPPNPPKKAQQHSDYPEANNPWIKKQQREGKLPLHLPSLKELLAGSSNPSGNTPDYSNAPIPPDSPAGLLIQNKVITDQLNQLTQQRNLLLQNISKATQSFNSESAEQLKQMTDLAKQTQEKIDALRQQQQKVIQQIPKLNLPPIAPYILAGLGTVLAAFALGRTKSNLGRIAVGSFLTGLLTGRQALIQQGIEQYKSILNQATEKYNMLQNNINNILNSTKLSLDEKQNELSILAQKYGFIIKDNEDLVKGLDSLQKSLQAGNIALAKMQEIAQYHQQLLELKQQDLELKQEIAATNDEYKKARLLQEDKRIQLEKQKLEQKISNASLFGNMGVPQQQQGQQPSLFNGAP